MSTGTIEPTDRDRELAREWYLKWLHSHASCLVDYFAGCAAKARAEGYEAGRTAALNEVAGNVLEPDQCVFDDRSLGDRDAEKLAKAIRNMPAGRIISGDGPLRLMPMRSGDAMAMLHGYQSDLAERIKLDMEMESRYDPDLDGDREEPGQVPDDGA